LRPLQIEGQYESKALFAAEVILFQPEVEMELSYGNFIYVLLTQQIQGNYSAHGAKKTPQRAEKNGMRGKEAETIRGVPCVPYLFRTLRRFS